MTDKYRMDSHKLYWHLDRVNQWQKGERIAPLHLDMGISRGCNMACTYCYGILQGRTGYGADSKDVFNMPAEAVKRTFSDAKQIGVRSIALIGEGENTLNPALYDSVEYADSIGLDLGLATNGVKINHDRLQGLLNGLTWLRVNISAGEKDAYKRVHQVDALERVAKNVEAIVAANNKYGTKCTIGLQMVMTKDNFDQVIPLAKLGRETGVDYFVVKPCSDTSDRLLDSPTDEYGQNMDIFEKARTYSTDTYSVVPKIAKLSNNGHKDYSVCHGTKFILAVSANGDVFPCGHWFNFHQDDYRMGNVIETPFADIVSSERYWEVQDRVMRVNVNRDCETNCRQHYVNQFLYNLASPPDHVNFI